MLEFFNLNQRYRAHINELVERRGRAAAASAGQQADQPGVPSAGQQADQPGVPSAGQAQGGVAASADVPAVKTSPRTMSLVEQFVLFGALVIGVIAAPLIKYAKPGAPTPPELQFSLILFVLSVVVALVVSAAAFQKFGMAPDTPWPVKIGFFVQQGLFWPQLFDAATDTA